MNKFQVFFIWAIIAITSAEPPIQGGGYSYSLAPSGSGNSIGTIDYSTIGNIGGYDSSSLIGGGGYAEVSTGYQTYEGQNVDPTLLHKVKEILVNQENIEESRRANSGHSNLYNLNHGLLSTYGVPSGHYGVPSYASRVVGIQLDHITPARQVAQYHQIQQLAAPSLQIPSGLYGAPSVSYGIPHH